MSYILDALRKSEQQRQLGVAPRLLTVHAFEPDAQPAFLKYGLIAAALTGAGVAIGWWQPWQQERLLSATETITARMPEARPREPLPVPLPVLPEVASEPEMPMPVQTLVAMRPIPAPDVAPLKQDMQLPAKAPPQTRKPPPAAAVLQNETATPVPEAAPAPAPALAVAAETPIALLHEKSANAAPADPAQEQRVLLMAELPAAIRREIPAMAIPVHTYSETPTERIVGINDRLLREGEYLAPGLKLELIAPDGVVFSYKKYLFRHGL